MKKNNMRKVIATILMLSLAAMLLLTGCGSGGNGGSGDADKTPEFPTENVSVIVNYAAGGTTDTIIRALINGVDSSKLNGQSLLVENVAGSGGLVGVTQLANSKPDGYTIGVVNSDVCLSMALGYTDLTVDDFYGLVCCSNAFYGIFTKADGKYQTLEALVEAAKANPGEIKIADCGVASATFLVTTVLEKQLGVDFKTVTYDSTAEGVTAVLAGDCDAVVGGAAAVAGQMEAGEMMAVAVSNTDGMSSLPGVPGYGSIYDELKDTPVAGFICLVALPGTPDYAIDFFNDILTTACNSDEFAEISKAIMNEPSGFTTAKEVQDFMTEQYNIYVEFLADIEA